MKLQKQPAVEAAGAAAAIANEVNEVP
jgi:hypothetical protein